MHNLFSFGLCALLLCVCAAQSAEPIQQDDNFKIMGSLVELYDSNYTRTPDKTSEQITEPSLGLSLNENWSNQQLSARWQGTRFIFDKLFDSAASLQTGALDWQSLWPMGFKSSLNLKQDGYLVDQLEFAGVDVSTQDLMVGRFGYGFSDGWSFNLGGRDLKQLHSNDELNRLEYNETDAFVELGYATPSGSSAVFRGRSGKRSYRNEVEAIDDLNYDYTQTEIETKWIVSPKTDIELLVARYNRNGTINSGTGTMASFEANWVPTEKLQFKTVYSLQHPAIGESEDGSSKVQTAMLFAQWQVTSKLGFGTRLSYSRSHYVNPNSYLERNETLTNYSPLTISYLPTSHWQLKLDSGWRKNESPLSYRQYISAQATIGAFFSY